MREFNTAEQVLVEQNIHQKVSFADRADVIKFINNLVVTGLEFHFDDSVYDIFEGQFEQEHLDMFAANIDRMWETCNRLHIDPFDIALRITGNDDPESDYYGKKPVPFKTDTARMSEFYLAVLRMECPGDIEDRDQALNTVKVVGVYPQSAEETLAFEAAYEEYANGQY